MSGIGVKDCVGQRYKYLRSEHWVPVIESDVNRESSSSSEEIGSHDVRHSPARNIGTLMRWRDLGCTVVMSYAEISSQTDNESNCSSFPATPAKRSGSRYLHLLAEHYSSTPLECCSPTESTREFPNIDHAEGRLEA